MHKIRGGKYVCATKTCAVSLTALDNSIWELVQQATADQHQSRKTDTVALTTSATNLLHGFCFSALQPASTYSHATLLFIFLKLT